MPDDEELMEAHVRALFTHDARSRLLRVREPGGGSPAPRLLYSTSLENRASQAVAAKLRLVQYGADFHIT